MGALKIRLLPSNLTGDGQLQMLTSFLINGCVAVDAGSLVVALSPEELPAIRHVLITHAHTDHIASLPVFVAEAYKGLDTPITIYGIEEVIQDLQECVFNDRIFPDFASIQLQNEGGGSIRYQALEPRRTVEVAGLRVTAIPVNHTVPSCGLIVRDESATLAITSTATAPVERWTQ